MAQQTEIAWCDSTFNPWIGCTKVSPGCAHCYAERDFDLRKHMAKWGAGQPRHRTSEAYWKQPLKWDRDQAELVRCANLAGEHPPRRPRVFCASLADWLDDEVPVEWLADLLDLIRRTPSLDWLLLTKRPHLWQKRINAAKVSIGRGPRIETAAMLNNWAGFFGTGEPPANVWIGTTVEDQVRADERIPALLSIPARVRFLSCEPLLGPVQLSTWIEPFVRCASCGECYDLDEVVPDPDGASQGADQCSKCGVKGCMCSYEGTAARARWENGDVTEADIHSTNPSIDWVICGGESGPHARPMHPDWARSLRDQCATAHVPVLFKQWGEWAGNEYPADGVVHVRADGSIGDFPLKDSWSMKRVGKHAAGRLLDGREHNEFPEVR